RVGFHVGPAIEDEGDVFGDAVNLAARVAAMAKGGETLLTGESVRLLSSMYVANTRLLDTTTLKGKSETVDIFSVVSGREDETTMRGVNVRAAKPVQSEPSLIITFGDREISISRPEERILVGRDEECDIVVDARYASRRHAMFMAQRHRFLLIDQSTNGTFLKGEDGQLVVLKREFQQLVGSGEVSFGEKPEAEPEMVIRYRIET
ncbi:MAG: adenylate/guanylate cyclase domain-containing protein, partial [Pseudomonadota bacterium]|nr:adenylate/guanylate cyclase domain-containing protein [Pseudomonadota bacterium]